MLRLSRHLVGLVRVVVVATALEEQKDATVVLHLTTAYQRVHI
jgi:hypothetical protein